jgi:hypothetical protein
LKPGGALGWTRLGAVIDARGPSDGDCRQCPINIGRLDRPVDHRYRSIAFTGMKRSFEPTGLTMSAAPIPSKTRPVLLQMPIRMSPPLGQAHVRVAIPTLFLLSTVARNSSRLSMSAESSSGSGMGRRPTGEAASCSNFELFDMPASICL